MKFVYDNNRSPLEQRVFEAATASPWLVREVFPGDTASDYLDEATRLKWAPVLLSLTFGEATALQGFGDRIADADDLSTKSWLVTHLSDEARHTEGFARLLDHLYPSYRGRHSTLFGSKDVYVFYGHTQRAEDLLSWLISTQIAEVFGQQCYKALASALAAEPRAAQFIHNILVDEARHIGYVHSLISSRRDGMSEGHWRDVYEPFVLRMVELGRNMFESRRIGRNYRSFDALGIDVTSFCDRATEQLYRKYVK